MYESTIKAIIYKAKFKIFGGERKFPDVSDSSVEPLPVLIYQMGKVASKSIYDSLKAYGLSVFHVHRIGLDIHPNLYKRILLSDEPVKIITLVRDPVGRSMSAFFQHLNSYCKTKNILNLSISQLKQFYLDMPDSEFQTSINWFDDEFKKVIGIDVFEYKFPAQVGYLTISSKNREILIMRVDIEDAVKNKSICEFLGIDGLQITKSNMTDKGGKGIVYKEFREKISLPNSLLDRLLNSKYTNHFFSTGEIHEFYSRWGDDGGGRQGAD